VPYVIGRSGIELPTPPERGDDAALAPSWASFTSALQAALDDPDVAGRTFDAGPPGEMQVGQAIDRLVTGDILVHTWDLATALGEDVQLDPTLVPEMLAGMEPIDEVLRGSGHYGPKVHLAADDIDPQRRLVAFTGRDPDWAPA
jgi:uncharacterized protein (TIGR03086 family)